MHWIHTSFQGWWGQASPRIVDDILLVLAFSFFYLSIFFAFSSLTAWFESAFLYCVQTAATAGFSSVYYYIVSSLFLYITLNTYNLMSVLSHSSFFLFTLVVFRFFSKKSDTDWLLFFCGTFYMCVCVCIFLCFDCCCCCFYSLLIPITICMYIVIYVCMCVRMYEKKNEKRIIMMKKESKKKEIENNTLIMFTVVVAITFIIIINAVKWMKKYRINRHVLKWNRFLKHNWNPCWTLDFWVSIDWVFYFIDKTKLDNRLKIINFSLYCTKKVFLFCYVIRAK